MNRAQAEMELAWLLEKIKKSEDLLRRCEEFVAQRGCDWSHEIIGSLEIYFERKREQICFEKETAHRLGTAIALDRYPKHPDI